MSRVCLQKQYRARVIDGKKQWMKDISNIMLILANDLWLKLIEILTANHRNASRFHATQQSMYTVLQPAVVVLAAEPEAGTEGRDK